jgi:hypothetical protein
VHHYDLGSEKPGTSILSLHFYQKEKFQDSAFHWKMYAHHFTMLQRHYSPGVHGERMEISAETYMKTQKKFKW